MLLSAVSAPAAVISYDFTPPEELTAYTMQGTLFICTTDCGG